MSALIIVGLAIAAVAATTTSLGSLMKSRGARTSVRMRHDHPLHSMRKMFGSGWFTGGVLIATTGGVLHIASLGFAPISTVQAVMASSVGIVGVMAERLFGWPVPRRQRIGIGFTTVGLIALAVSMPAVHSAHSAFQSSTMIIFDGTLLVVGSLLLLTSRTAWVRPHDGVLIGAASGILFAVSDLAVKALFAVVKHGPVSLLLSPWLATAVVGGVVAQYLSARSLQTGDGVSVIALSGAAVNVVNISGGILIFGDPLAHGLAGSVAEIGAFAAICLGAMVTPVGALSEIAAPPPDDAKTPAEELRESC